MTQAATVGGGPKAEFPLTEIPHRVVLLSFEGPDRYASIGGLGTRVSQLAQALGAIGCVVDVIFVGDPAAAPVEPYGKNVTLRRWSQWISTHHPRNAYDGEDQKVLDWESSLPPFVVDSIVTPTAAAGERTLVLAEEWQTAGVAIAIDRLARLRKVRESMTLMWNANNTYGWDRIDWNALRASAGITAVSKIREVRARLALRRSVARDPQRDRPAAPERGRSAAGGRDEAGPGRTPDAGQSRALRSRQALDARSDRRAGRAARGRDQRPLDRARRPRAVCRRSVRAGATSAASTSSGSPTKRVPTATKVIDGIALAEGPIVHLRAFLDEQTLFALYAGADAVLASSGREPFGLVEASK